MGQLIQVDFLARNLKPQPEAEAQEAQAQEAEAAAAAQALQADHWYRQGCALDESTRQFKSAKRCYRMALRLNPRHTGAMVNLGNLWFKEAKPKHAVALYRKALRVDPKHAEANYNLGYCLFDAGKPLQAIKCLQVAIKSAPTFADPHFNLALALGEIGRSNEAAQHWRAYLRLEPVGPWSDDARRRLALIRYKQVPSLRLVP